MPMLLQALPERGRVQPFTPATDLELLFTRCAFGLLWLLVLAIPCEGEIPIPFFGSISRVIGAVAFFAALAAVMARGHLRRADPAHAPALLFVGWIGASYLWSVSPPVTAARIATFAQLLLLGWMIWQQASSERKAVALMRAFVIGAWISAANTVFNYLRGATANTMRFGDAEANGRTLSQFRYKVERYTAAGLNEDELALVLALSIPMACYLIGRSCNLRTSWIFWLHVPCAAMAIILSGSRGGMFASLAAIVYLLTTVPEIAQWKRRLYLLTASAGLVIALCLPAVMWARFLRAGSEITEGSLSKRTVIWRAGMEVFRDHPFAGVGSDAYADSIAGRLDASRSAHNSFMAVLVELGAIGLSLFLALLAGLWVTAASLPRAARRMWMAVLCVWLIGVQSLSFEHRKTTWCLFALLIAHASSVRRWTWAGSPYVGPQG